MNKRKAEIKRQRHIHSVLCDIVREVYEENHQKMDDVFEAIAAYRCNKFLVFNKYDNYLCDVQPTDVEGEVSISIGKTESIGLLYLGKPK